MELHLPELCYSIFPLYLDQLGRTNRGVILYWTEFVKKFFRLAAELHWWFG